MDTENNTRVINCKDEDCDVYIGRGSKWGNPYKIDVDGTRSEVIELYESWIREQPELMAALDELEDKVLGCWCKPLDCHGDVLVKLLKRKKNRNLVDNLFE